MNKVFYDETSLLYQNVRKELSYELSRLVLFISPITAPGSDTVIYNHLGFEFEFSADGIPVAISYEIPLVCDVSAIVASDIAAIIKNYADQTISNLQKQKE